MTRLLVSARLAPCAATPRDAVYNGVKVIARDGDFYESYAPGSLRLARAGATVQLGHDTDAIGHVVTVAGSKDWIHADFVVEDPDAETLERLRPGVPVSLGARSLAADTDLDLRLKRHLLCELAPRHGE